MNSADRPDASPRLGACSPRHDAAFQPLLFSRLTEFVIVFIPFAIFPFVVVFAAIPDFATAFFVVLGFAFAGAEAPISM